MTAPPSELADFLPDNHVLTPNLWEPLPTERHTRLLNIHPVRENYESDVQGKPQCSLEVVHLDAVKGQYEALSYAWGDKKDGTGLIDCNGREVMVWKNLYQALLRLHRKTAVGQVRKLWVDALSIDQYDMEERADQILLMREIFSQASQVLIWVGEQDEASQHAFRAIEFSHWPLSRRTSSGFHHDIQLLGVFFSRTWFQRLWTIQEVVLSSKSLLICGAAEIDWTEFCEVWRWYPLLMHDDEGPGHEFFLNNAHVIGLRNIQDLRRRLRANRGNRHSRPSLSEILMQTWHRSATVSHDRIYAILGLISTERYHDLTPDYTVSAVAVFTDITKKVMEVDRSIALLSLAGYSRTEEPFYEAADTHSFARVPVQGRPSWVPDFLHQDSDMSRLDQPGKPGYLYNPDTVMVSSLVFCGDRLHVEGHVVGELRVDHFVKLNKFYHSQIPEEYVTDDKLPGSRADAIRNGDLVCNFGDSPFLFVLRQASGDCFLDIRDLKLAGAIAEDPKRLDCVLLGPCTIELTESGRPFADFDRDLEAVTFAIW